MSKAVRVRAAAAQSGAARRPVLLLTPHAWITALGVLLALLAYATLPGTGAWSRHVLSGVRLLYANRNASEDLRGRSLMGDAYALIRHAERTTPPGSRILIPSGARYDPLSNRVWSAYYLHPRRILEEKDLGPDLESSADYVLVYHGWYLKEVGLPEDSTMNAVLEVARLHAPGRSGGPSR
jgi:hypothetical protein